MSEKQPNKPRSFSRFSDWCRHIDSLSESARHTVEVLLKNAGTDDAEAAERILSSRKNLDLYNNKITDISSLGSLVNLTTLNLDNNRITDISSLGSLLNLTTLNLDNNRISNISSLGSLLNLTTLNLDNNRITDISSLGSLVNLTTLHLGNNRISNISSLGSLVNLTTLYLYENQIPDFSSLGSLVNLTTLHLGCNKGIRDISSLGSLVNLTTLSLGCKRTTDFSSLGSLVNLTTLHLGCKGITNFSSLGSLVNLTTLILDWNQITDITSLGSLTNLTTLSLKENQITDISSLGSLVNLTTLILDCNRITDITSLGSLTNLTKLIIDHNRITDISALRELVNLTELDLHHNPISDINPLRSLTNLKKIDLRQTTFDFHNRKREIIDISVLGEFTQKRLALLTKPIDAEKATEAVKIAYAAIGLEAPEVIICSSPRDAYLQIFNLLKCDRSQNCSNEWRWNRSGQKLGRKMFSSVAREFTSRVMWMYERFHLIGGFESQADGALRLLMHELVDSYARSEETMGNSYPDHLLSLKSPETPPTLLKAIYSTELYLSLSGINLSEKAQKIHLFQKLLFEDCGWIFPFEKICAVCDRPRHLRFDSQNRLHAEGEPAIEFADGWSFYYYHGVRLPENYGNLHPDLWKAEWLLAEENAEVRRVLIEAIGYDRICQELAAEQIDSWQEYALLRIDNADVEPIYLLKMTCPSTGFIHALRVPPNVTSAREAIRWVNGGIDPEEFSVQS